MQLAACLWFAEEIEHLAFANYAEVLGGPFLVELDAMAPRPLIVRIHVQLDSYLFHGPRGSVLANPEAVEAVEALIGPVLRA